VPEEAFTEYKVNYVAMGTFQRSGIGEIGAKMRRDAAEAMDVVVGLGRRLAW
jgi:hypothetical protein